MEHAPAFIAAVGSAILLIVTMIAAKHRHGRVIVLESKKVDGRLIGFGLVAGAAAGVMIGQETGWYFGPWAIVFCNIIFAVWIFAGMHNLNNEE